MACTGPEKQRAGPCLCILQAPLAQLGLHTVLHADTAAYVNFLPIGVPWGALPIWRCLFWRDHCLAHRLWLVWTPVAIQPWQHPSFLGPSWRVLRADFPFIESQSGPWTCWEVLVTEEGHCCFDARKWRLNIGNGAMPLEKMAYFSEILKIRSFSLD